MLKGIRFFVPKARPLHKDATPCYPFPEPRCLG